MSKSVFKSAPVEKDIGSRTALEFTIGTVPTKFNYLDQPDEYKGKVFYKTTAVLTSEQAEEIQAALDAFLEREIAKDIERREATAETPKDKANLKKRKEAARWQCVKEETELDDDGESVPTGNYELLFKQNSTIKNRKGEEREIHPTVFDSKGNVITGRSKAYGGSLLNISGQAVLFWANDKEHYGLAIRLRATQVIQRGGGTPQDVESFGFEVVEDGFVAEEETPTSTEEGDVTDGANF